MRSMWQEEILLPSEVWQIMYMFKNKLMVFDPDGWDRKNWEKSWGEKITWKEFCARAVRSTLVPADEEVIAKALWVLSEGKNES